MGGGGGERGNGLHTHPRSPFTAVPVEEKQKRQPFNVSERRGFSRLSLNITAGTIRYQSQHFTAPLRRP